MKQLKDLVADISATVTFCGSEEVSISGIAIDSRVVRRGDLFAALPGSHTDGLQYAGAAVAAGAHAVLAQVPPPPSLLPLPPHLAWLQADCPRTALAALAAAFFGHPSRSLTLVGVTGTNGKNTVCYLLESIFGAAGFSAGALGTVSVRFAGRERSSPLTTPEAHELQRTLAEMVAAGVTHVAMEVSSHAIEQRRSAHCCFTTGLFTNLSRDHLDYHGDLATYAAAKQRLFDEDLPACAARGVTINLDDAVGRAIAASTPLPVVGFTLRPEGPPEAAVRVAELSYDIDGGRIVLATPRGRLALSTPLLGRHNIENVVSAASVCELLDLPHEAVIRGVAALKAVPGRLERIETDNGVAVLVDYAHTDDALANVTQALAPLTRGRLITVFGCGGDRDRTKRPVMGRVAARNSDIMVVTSDNPRTEEPHAIIDEILPGLREAGAAELPWDAIATAARGFVVEVDRRRAIEAAVRIARPGDTVLVAGKGHEDYQIIGHERQHFDDREVLREALATPNRQD